MNSGKLTIFITLLSIFLLSCVKKEKNNSEELASAYVLSMKTVSSEEKSSVVGIYANTAFYHYRQSYESALNLQTAVNSLYSSGDSANSDQLVNAQNAWIKSRADYLLTEAYRFSNGPVDNTDLLTCDGGDCEGMLNAWPLDEDSITSFITQKSISDITKTNILAANGSAVDASGAAVPNPEKNVTVGWHAIEYLLWGKDSSVNSAGPNTISYFTETTNNNGAKRRTYLKVVTDLLVSHLLLLTNKWDPTNGNYSDEFKVSVDSSFENIFKGLGKVIAGEFAGDRLTGLFTGDQEEEHSCFSDNTKSDFFYDMQGLINVVKGVNNGDDEAIATDGSTTRTTIYNLISKQDPTLANSIVANLSLAKDSFCLNIYTSDPNYSSICSSSSISGRYDQAINSSNSEYSKLTDFQELLGVTIKEEIVKAGEIVGISVTDLSL